MYVQNEFYMMNTNSLKHHGIIGQKWGVRRYQNPDGTLTAAGKQRLAKSEYKNTKKEIKAEAKAERAASPSVINKDTAVKAAIAGAAGITLIAATAYITKNPEIAVSVGKAVGKTAGVSVKIASKIPGAKIAGKAVERFGETAVDTASTMAVAGAATYAVKKIDERYNKLDKPNSQIGKEAQKIAKESTKKGVEEALYAVKPSARNYGKNSTSTVGGNGTVSNDIKAKVGEPRNKNNPVDRSSQRWANLLNGLPNEQKNAIRAMGQAGYDWDQLEAYRKTL